MEHYKKTIGKNGGFTLVELMIAMSIFVVFMGVLISSYTGIVRAQSEADDFRVLIADGRRVFDRVTEEVRDGRIDYLENGEVVAAFNGVNDTLILGGQDGDVSFEHIDESLVFTAEDGTEFVLNSVEEGVRVTDFNVFVSPVADPYNSANVAADSIQFQPKVTIYAKFEKDRRGKDPYFFDLQTTISSRSYVPN